MDLGARLRKLRVKAHLSQEQVGDRLTPPITRAAVANIEGGKQRILAHTLAQLALMYEASVDALFAELHTHEARNRHSDVLREISEKLAIGPTELRKLAAALRLEELSRLIR